MPVRTPWTGGHAAAAVAEQLANQLRRLNVVRGWLRLESAPPATGLFPYRLEMRSAATLAPIADGTLYRGERYRLVLRADRARLERGFVRRWVYVFVVDSLGRIQRLLPEGSGNQGNYLPPLAHGPTGVPTDIPIGALLRAAPPLGQDLLVLFSSSKPVAVSNLVGGPTRALQGAPNWSVQKLLLTTVETGGGGKPP
jgi:hypothetical protein